ncbi:MAG: glycosyltransferase [Fimbriimonadales bacterium]|nr:glycosyltransferase [Fimbriimonadales bacterium]
MLKHPLVSILTPAYKAEPYIGQAIESVLAQTMPDWELIIVEDCSPDNTAQVVEQYLGDPRIKLIRNEQNLGECGSRNRALDVARGEWIALLDADDWYEPNRLERLMQTAEETGEKVVLDLMRRVPPYANEPAVTLSPIYPIPAKVTRYTIYQYVYGHLAGQPLFRRDLVEQDHLRYIPGILRGGDYIFQIQLIHRAGGRLIVLPEALYNYRVHPQSMVGLLRDDLSKIHVLYQNLLKLPEVQQDSRLHRAVQVDYRRELGRNRLSRFNDSLRRADWRGLWQLIRETPSVLEAFVWRRREKLLRKLYPRLRAWE